MLINSEKVKIAMAEHGYSVKDLAREYGCTDVNIHGILSGKYKARPATVSKLAKALGKQVSEIVTF